MPFQAVILSIENCTVLQPVMLVTLYVISRAAVLLHAKVTESYSTVDYPPLRAGNTEMQRICNRFPLD